MQDLNRRSASGPDRVSNKALRNLNDAAVTALTAYFNKCWRAGKLPRQWKEAKTILIPKPGKSPDIENLRPISLTSCVGKLLEHILMTRWQQYLEEAELYPDSLVGFRSKLGTQDAMLQLKKEILVEYSCLAGVKFSQQRHHSFCGDRAGIYLYISTEEQQLPYHGSTLRHNGKTTLGAW
ncbi:hypothetical protein ISCGN_022255 [Ixodes scapularis]